VATYGNETGLVFSASVTAGHGEAIATGDTVTVTQGANAVCTISLTAGTGSCSPSAVPGPRPSGTYTNGITATFNSTGTDTNFPAAANKTASLTVGKGSQTIAFTSSAPTAAAINGTYAPTAPATSGLAVTFTSATSTTCSVTAGVVKFLAVGTCTINANQAGNANYTAAAQVQQSVTVHIGVLVFTTAAASGSTSSTPNLGPITMERQDGAGNPITIAEREPDRVSQPLRRCDLRRIAVRHPDHPVVHHERRDQRCHLLVREHSPRYLDHHHRRHRRPYIGRAGRDDHRGPGGIGHASRRHRIDRYTRGGLRGGEHQLHLCGHRSAQCRQGRVLRRVGRLRRTPVVYSDTQDSDIAETGKNTGTATITAGSSSSGPTTLTASHSGSTTQTSTLTFGPYSLTITVSS
jgi:hypothetical protein